MDNIALLQFKLTTVDIALKEAINIMNIIIEENKTLKAENIKLKGEKDD